MGAPRTYTDAQRSDALVRLAANGGALRRTARETGIPETTLRQWSKGTYAPEARQRSAVKMRPAAEDCERIAALILGHLETKYDTATLVGSATVFGILLDKAAMLRQTADVYDTADDPDLSLLTPEQLDTLDAWIQQGRAREEPGTATDGIIHEVDVAGVPVELAPPGIVPVPGRPSDGPDQAAHGVHAAPAREE